MVKGEEGFMTQILDEGKNQEQPMRRRDSRHQERMAMVQALYVDEFPGQSWENLEINYDRELLEEIRQRKVEYDAQIQQIATERPVTDLSKVDLVILRLILHERATRGTPIKVLIDEGVELAKDFGGEHSYAFINAVLEKLLLPQGEDDTIQAET
jgi:N utilization substance protein B